MAKVYLIELFEITFKSFEFAHEVMHRVTLKINPSRVSHNAKEFVMLSLYVEEFKGNFPPNVICPIIPNAWRMVKQWRVKKSSRWVQEGIFPFVISEGLIKLTHIPSRPLTTITPSKKATHVP